MDAGAQVEKAKKYVRLAAVWFIVVGALSIIAGLAGILDKGYFEGGDSLSGDVQMWGVIWLIEGVVNVVVGGLILRGSRGARNFGVFLACLGILVWFFCVGIVPIWGVVHIVAYGFVVHWLLAYGGD